MYGLVNVMVRYVSDYINGILFILFLLDGHVTVAVTFRRSSLKMEIFISKTTVFHLLRSGRRNSVFYSYLLQS